MSTYVKGARVTGMTIARAKEIARAELGRLPKMGREVCVFERSTTIPALAYGDRVYHAPAVYRIYLVNTSGRLSLKEITV